MINVLKWRSGRVNHGYASYERPIIKTLSLADTEAKLTELENAQ